MTIETYKYFTVASDVTKLFELLNKHVHEPIKHKVPHKTEKKKENKNPFKTRVTHFRIPQEKKKKIKPMKKKKADIESILVDDAEVVSVDDCGAKKDSLRDEAVIVVEDVPPPPAVPSSALSSPSSPPADEVRFVDLSSIRVFRRFRPKMHSKDG